MTCCVLPSSGPAVFDGAMHQFQQRAAQLAFLEGLGQQHKHVRMLDALSTWSQSEQVGKSSNARTRFLAAPAAERLRPCVSPLQEEDDLMQRDQLDGVSLGLEKLSPSGT